MATGIFDGSTAIIAVYDGATPILKVYDGATLIADFSEAPVGGDIDHVETKATYVSDTRSTTHTLSFAVATTGPNRKLIVSAGTEATSGNQTRAFTYNGQALSSAVEAVNGDNEVEIFYLDDADLPTDGASHDLVLTLGISDHAEMGAVEYKNAAQGAPSHTGTDTAAGGDQTSITLVSVSEGALVIDAVTNRTNTTYTPGASQTERFDISGTPDTTTLACSDQVGVTAGNVTMTQTPGTSASAHCAAAWAVAEGGEEPPSVEDDTFDTFNTFSGPVVDEITGDQGHDDYDLAGSDSVTLTQESRIDARGSTWHQHPPPTQQFQANVGGNFQNPPDNAVAWIGGLWLGETPLDASYDDVKPVGSKALMMNSHGGVIDGVRLWNTHEDAITLSHGENAARSAHPMSYIRNCWIDLTLGDAIENDHIANLTIEDCLLDRVYTPISVDPGGAYNGSGEEDANLIVIDNCLIRTRSAVSEGNANYFGWVKTNHETCPHFELHNNVLAFDGWADTFAFDEGPPGRWKRVLDNLDAASNNTVCWLLDTPIPGPSTFPALPSGFTVLTGQDARDLWEKAKQNWIDCHPNIAHAPGDPDAVPANADPDFYGSGNL